MSNDKAHKGSIKASEKKALASRSSKEATDKEWDKAQGPLRAKLSDMADKVTQNSWNGGKKVSRKTASQFAVDVLLRVRQSFYDRVANDAAAAQAAGRTPVVDPPQGPWTQKLTLENMKWIFDTKIEQHTDRYCKEPFLCNGCQGQRKPYGLQSIIQHYAAKHTNALSMGNVVVCWRAEWPKKPVFDPDPTGQNAKKAAEGSQHNASTGPQKPYGYVGYDAQPAVSHAPYGVPSQPHAYAAQAPPNAFQAPPYAARVMPPTAYGVTCRSYQPTPQALALPPYPQPPQYADARYPAAVAGPGASSSGAGNVNVKSSSVVPANAAQYVSRLNLMAAVTKEALAKMAHVKDLPDAARACVLIHHIATRFEKNFSEPPPLDLFVEGLSHHKDFRPARSIKWLRCKACELTAGPGDGIGLRTLPDLLTHFKMTHGDEAGGRPSDGPLDWRVHMVSPPDKEAMSGLQRGPGMPNAALQMVVEALPWAFEADASRAPIARQQQDAMGKHLPQKKSTAAAANGSHGPSKAESCQLQHKLEEARAAEHRTAAAGADGNAGPVGHTDGPVLRPASAVYRRADTSRQTARTQSVAPQGGGRRHPRKTHGDVGPEGVKRRPAAARAWPGRPEGNGFNGGGQGSQMEAETPGRDVRYDGRRQAYSAPWSGYAAEREHAADRYCAPAPAAPPAHNGYGHG